MSAHLAQSITRSAGRPCVAETPLQAVEGALYESTRPLIRYRDRVVPTRDRYAEKLLRSLDLHDRASNAGDHATARRAAVAARVYLQATVDIAAEGDGCVAETFDWARAACGLLERLEGLFTGRCLESEATP